jgi:hypothetical protein
MLGVALDDDQKQALSMAIGVISARVDQHFNADDREGNVLMLLDHYIATIYDSDAKVSAGLATLADILIHKLAQETRQVPEAILQQVKRDFALA